MRDWEVSCAEGGQRQQVICWEFGWDRDAEDVFCCWSILPEAAASLPQDCGMCSCTVRGPSFLTVGLCEKSQRCCSAEPQDQATQAGSPERTSSPPQCPQGKGGVPCSTERLCRCIFVCVQHCTPSC